MWSQVYDPLHNAWLSTALAAAPVAILLGMLACGASALRSAAAGLAAAFAVAVFGYGMPISAACAAAGYGGCFGLYPIGWIVFNAVFFYRLGVHAGSFEVVKRSVSALSPDRRIQAILVAFCFGAFVEGAAGFGTPVAVSSAMLIGLGFPPLLAAGLSLLANTAPVAFGGLGIPIVTLARMVESDEVRRPAVELALSAMAGRQLPFFAVLVPIWLVWILAGFRGVLGVWPAILVGGGSFGLIQFLLSNFHGPTAVDVVGGVGSLVILALFLRVWKPKDVWRFPGESGEIERTEPPPFAVAWRAWLPWVLLSLLVFVWALPAMKERLKAVGGVKVQVPYLHHKIERGPEVAAKPTPEAAEYEFFPLAAAGTAIFAAAVLAAMWFRLSPGDFGRVWCSTLVSVAEALVTIVLMLALAHITKFCGSDATMGLAFTNAGWLYPFFAPLLGWLGVALTGSDTASNALFGGLQKITAEKLGLDPILIAASNSTGGVMGKMVDAQSIVVAAAATGQHRQEGAILRFVFVHSVVLAALVGLLTMLQATVLRGMVPVVAF